MKSILVISDKDQCWLEPFWFQMFQLEQETFRIEKIVTVPGKLSNLNSSRAKMWFLKQFGLNQTLLLQLFYLIRKIQYNATNIFNRKKHRFSKEFVRLDEFNSNRIREILNQVQPDIVFITTSHVIPEELLVSSSAVWLNKHASILPNFKGLFPFFWASFFDSQLGYSIHVVTKYIDSGRIVFQEILPSHTSMTSFYLNVFESFGSNFEAIIKTELNGTRVPVTSSNTNSYSLPKRREVKVWYKRGFRVINWGDFLTFVV